MTRSKSTERLQILQSLSRELCANAIDKFGAQRIPRANSILSHRAQLHATVLHLATSSLALYEAGLFAGMPILSRTALEAQVEQIALTRDPKYQRRAAASSLKAARAIPKVVARAGQEVLEMLRHPESRASMRAMEERAKEIGIDKMVAPTVEEKFEAAGMELYYPVHKLLGGEVHNDGGALGARHVDSSPTKEVHVIEPFKRPPDEELIHRLEMVAMTLVESALDYHGQDAKEFLDLKQRLLDQHVPPDSNPVSFCCGSGMSGEDEPDA